MAIYLEDLQQEHEKNKWASLLEKDARVLQHIKNPTAEMCDSAMRRNPDLLFCVPQDKRNYSMEMCAVKFNPENIQYIENPSEELCFLAVSKMPFSIRFIKDPSLQVQLLAVSQKFKTLNHIKNPSEQVVIHAAKSNPNSLITETCHEINTPAMCLAFLESDKFNYRYVKICENDNYDQTFDTLTKMQEKVLFLNKIKNL